jgi:hypothetical protein
MKSSTAAVAFASLLATSAHAAPIELGFSFDGCFIVSANGSDSLAISSGSWLGGELGNGQGHYQFGELSRITTGPLAAGIFPIIAPSAQPLSIDLAGSHLDGTVRWSQLDDTRRELSGVLTINHTVGFGADYVPGGTSEIDLDLMFEGGPPQSFDRILAGQQNLGLVLVSWGTIQPDQSPVSTPEPWSLVLLGTALVGTVVLRKSR